MSFGTDSSSRPPAGWYPDPAGSQNLRWWNGTEWTDHLSAPPAGQGAAGQQPGPGQQAAPAPQYGQQTQYGQQAAPAPQYGQQNQYGHQPAPAPQAAPPYSMHGAAQPQKLAEGTPVSTWAIWVIALLPLVSVVLSAVWNVENYARRAASPNPAEALYAQSDPGYLAVSFAGFVIYFATVALAFADRKILLDRGMDRPFHWAWAFLFGLVYVIGRGVVVRRRSGRGLAPMWVYIIVQVLSLVVAIVKAVEMVNIMIPILMSDMPQFPQT